MGPYSFATVKICTYGDSVKIIYPCKIDAVFRGVTKDDVGYLRECYNIMACKIRELEGGT